MTSTTLTTAPIAKSVQVPKKVRIVPIALVAFFFARVFREEESFRSVGALSHRSDRSNCVYIIDIVFVGYLSLSFIGEEKRFSNCWSRRFGVDRPKNASCCCFRARERERERERERATVLIQPFIVARDKEGHEGGGRRGPSWMMM